MPTRDHFHHRQTRKTYEEYCREPVTLQDLEDARDIIAYAITQDGPIYAPMLERLEREIREYRGREDVVARANALCRKPAPRSGGFGVGRGRRERDS